ncbi:MAG: right-handed parallel beta-helix repeat-containing protein, partial [Dysgonamonadaceae bacterium]|nr:right-handed parallel beta-helix repeat-containing protein [Dysgonamonadaceae bacterium]
MVNKLINIKTCFFAALLIGNTMYASEFTVKPTFEACGLYLYYEEETECKIFYRKTAEKDWHSAYPPIYDREKSEFRGSIVRLSENTDYTVKAEIYSASGKKQETFTENFKTWNSHPPIGKTIHISAFKNKDNDSYDINKVEGKPGGWIKIVGDQAVDALHTTRDYAIAVNRSRYLILEGITVAGGGKHGIFIDRSSSNIRIINCDISKWGRSSNIQNENGVYIDKNKNKINNDAGIRIERTGNIVVERCYIHDSRAKTNPWAGIIQDGPHKGTEYKSTHPEGPNGIHVTQATEGIVVRYNDVIGSQEHRYNDPIETAQNGYVDGGFNKDADIYGNVMAFGQDDGIELDGGQCNVRLFNNRIEQTFCGISVAPNRRGPSYIFNNLVWNLGNANGVESVAVKSGGDVNTTYGRQF